MYHVTELSDHNTPRQPLNSSIVSVYECTEHPSLAVCHVSSNCSLDIHKRWILSGQTLCHTFANKNAFVSVELHLDIYSLLVEDASFLLLVNGILTTQYRFMSPLLELNIFHTKHTHRCYVYSWIYSIETKAFTNAAFYEESRIKVKWNKSYIVFYNYLLKIDWTTQLVIFEIFTVLFFRCLKCIIQRYWVQKQFILFS